MGTTHGETPLGDSLGDPPGGRPFEDHPWGTSRKETTCMTLLAAPLSDTLWGTTLRGSPLGDPRTVNPHGELPWGSPSGNAHRRPPEGEPPREISVGEPSLVETLWRTIFEVPHMWNYPWGTTFRFQRRRTPLGEAPAGHTSGAQLGRHPLVDPIGDTP